jgi:hypothetical protein
VNDTCAFASYLRLEPLANTKLAWKRTVKRRGRRVASHGVFAVPGKMHMSEQSVTQATSASPFCDPASHGARVRVLRTVEARC